MTKRARKPTVMIGPATAKMLSFLCKDPREKGGYALFFCRGEGRCPKGPVHRRLAKQKCEDCVKGVAGETVEQLMERIEKGNG